MSYLSSFYVFTSIATVSITYGSTPCAITVNVDYARKTNQCNLAYDNGVFGDSVSIAIGSIGTVNVWLHTVDNNDPIVRYSVTYSDMPIMTQNAVFDYKNYGKRIR